MNDTTLPVDCDVLAQQAEIARLKKINKALMDRAERTSSAQATNFGLFEATVRLENQVQERTRELEAALRENRDITEALQREKEEQQLLIHQLEDAHVQLLQSEKLASIGQLAAGVAHEINNPIGFVSSNLGSLQSYLEQLLQLIDSYVAAEASLPAPLREKLEKQREEADLEFLRGDIPSLIAESIDGTTRVRRIVQDLRDFSRVGSNQWEWADLHAGLDSTLNVAWNEIKYKAEVVRNYGQLPEVECLPSQLNQVFLNLLVNAAQAIRERGTISIDTRAEDGQVRIAIRDTGSGIPAAILPRIFDPFFTTKPVGTGTGLGLALSYGIVEKHGGHIAVHSQEGEGTTFVVTLPVRQPAAVGSTEDAGA